MPENDSVLNWIKSLQAGEQEAVQQLWDRYFHRLRGLVSRRLPCHARRAFDEEDVALSAFRSFVSGVHQGRFPELDSPDNLWQVLAVIANRKTQSWLRHHNRQKRGGGEVRGESGVQRTEEQAGIGLDVLPGSEPSPEFAAQFVEQCQRLLDCLPNETLRTIALLKIQGHTIAEIAELVECTKRAVQRRLEIIRRTWREALSLEESHP